MRPASSQEEGKRRKGVLLGMGFDASDGQKRITKGNNFFLAGGSEETHERMTEKAMKFNERLKKKGKNIEDIRSEDEFRELMGE